MKKRDGPARVLIAVTEMSPVPDLWRAALNRIDRDAEVVALFLSDDRWRRAASLPFTREISRLGAVADFTRQRADQISRDSVARVRRSLAELAREADLAHSFEELSDRNTTRLEELVAGPRSVLIASSLITREPIYALILTLDCRIELVDSTDNRGEDDEE